MQPSKIDQYTPLWKKRNQWIVNYIPENSSILDIGCGNKSILEYIECDEYLGLDRTKYADIHTDLNTEKVEIKKLYDVGLIIGVLEYVIDPNDVISKYKDDAKKWIIVTKRNATERTKRKHGWKHHFTKPMLKTLLYKNFTNVKIITNTNEGYYVALCSKGAD